MPVLRREDGANFILQPYRETLTLKKHALLRKEIRYLSEQYGENVRLFKGESGEFEAVFSTDRGFLLGESVWQHFGAPPELIYCEKLPSQEIILVIVRENKVYLDAKLNEESLLEELNLLLTETEERYVVYAHGDLPKVFDHPAVKSFFPLTQSLFAALPISAQFQLLVLEKALEEVGLGLKNRSSLIVLTVICLAALGIAWWYVNIQEKPTIKVNPYEQYELSLQTPDPGQQMNALLKGIEKVNAIPGWIADSFTYDGQSAQLPLHSLGGTATDLLAKAQSLNMQANFSAQGASIIFQTEIKGRPTPDRIASSKETLALIIDRMMAILPGKSVKINDVRSNEVFNETGLTIIFTDVSPQVLQLIGSNLNDLPVTLKSVTATLKDGLYSGNLQLNIVGN
jgi:hypothetical protein